MNKKVLYIALCHILCDCGGNCDYGTVHELDSPEECFVAMKKIALAVESGLLKPNRRMIRIAKKRERSFHT